MTPKRGAEVTEHAACRLTPEEVAEIDRLRMRFDYSQSKAIRALVRICLAIAETDADVMRVGAVEVSEAIRKEVLTKLKKK